MGKSIIKGAKSKKEARKRAMSFVNKLTPEEQKQYTELFNSIDNDKSGALDQKEMIDLLKQTAMYKSDKQAKAVIKMYDIDGSGALEYSEFISMMEAWKSLSELDKNRQGASGELTKEDVERYKKIFSKIDKDNSGTINTKELSSAMKSLDLFDNAKQAEGIIIFFDMDESGDMGFPEFLTAICAATAMKDLRAEAQEAARIREEKSRACFGLFASLSK